jgi:hypothetical protein
VSSSAYNPLANRAKSLTHARVCVCDSRNLIVTRRSKSRKVVCESTPVQILSKKVWLFLNIRGGPSVTTRTHPLS